MSRSHNAGIKSSTFLGHRRNFQTGCLFHTCLLRNLPTMMQEHFLTRAVSACARGIIFFLYVTILFCFALATDRFVYLSHLRSWTIVLGHSRICGAFFNTHMPNPFLHPTNNVGHVSNFFPSFNIVKSGRRENCNKISKACTVL